jgi:predicted Fe-Mo cluster-binding NifX family protein
MRIAVASDDNVNVCGHVGKCKGFLIFDVENGKIFKKEIRENSFTDHFNRKHNDRNHHTQGRGHGSNDGHKRLAEGIKDCDYLVSHGMGRRLVEDLESLDIKTLVTIELDAECAAINLELGKLKHNNNLICG